VTHRLARLAVLAAAAALLAACNATNLLYSNIAFAYSNAAPMLTWAVDDYVDLSDGQKDWVRDRWARVIAWHRANELPEYRRFLTAFDASLEGGLTVDEVRNAQLDVRRGYERLVERVLPHMADLLLQVDPGQVEGLERKFAEDNRQVVKDGGRNTEERRTRSIRRTLDLLESWTGSLDASQRELISSHLRNLPDISAERMADRRYRQAETLALIRSKPDRDTMIAGLRRLVIDTDSWREAEYRKKLRERDLRNFEVISALSVTLSAEQKAQVRRRLRGFIADISTLVASR
jgi:hypothetical protein